MLLLVWLLLHYRNQLAEVLEEREEYADKLAELGFDHGKLKQEHKTLKEDHKRGGEVEKWLRGQKEMQELAIQNLEKRVCELCLEANEKSAEDEKRISELEKDLSSLRARYESTMTGLAEIARLIK
jgi:chromosome segregation ATPase